MSPESSANGTTTSPSPTGASSNVSSNGHRPNLPDQAKITERIEQKFGDFLETLGNTLMDFTALEVNTMIVSGITGAKFNALEAYRLIYERIEEINRLKPQKEAADQQKKEDPELDVKVEYSIHPDLWPRYERLRDQLLATFSDMSQMKTLPKPDDPQVAQQMKDVTFVRTIRKLSELRAALDGQKLESKTVDLIYAQTVMQLDGDVINRYNEKLFDPDNITRRDLILSIHNQGVEAGERQWRGLMQFMVDLLKNFVDRKFLDKP